MYMWTIWSLFRISLLMAHKCCDPHQSPMCSSGRRSLFSLLGGLSQNGLAKSRCVWPLALWSAIQGSCCIVIMAYVPSAPHVRHITFWRAQSKGTCHCKKERLCTALLLKCKAATHWIEEVRADIMLLYQQPSYTVHFAEDLAKF